MARDDGMPLGPVGDDFEGRLGSRTLPFGVAFNSPGSEPFYSFVDDNNNRILSSNTEKHHLISSEAYRSNTFLRELSSTTLDGKPLYDHNDFKTNGIRLPSTDRDAAILGAAKHLGREDNHRAYNNFIDQRMEEVERRFDTNKMQFEANGDSPEKAKLKAQVEAAKDIRGIQEWTKDKLVVKDGDSGPRIFTNINDPHGANNNLFGTSLDQMRGEESFEKGRGGGFIADVRTKDFRVRTDANGLKLEDAERSNIIARETVYTGTADQQGRVNWDEFKGKLDSPEFAKLNAEIEKGLASLDESDRSSVRKMDDLIKRVTDKDPKFAASWISDVHKVTTSDLKLYQNADSAVNSSSQRILDFFKKFAKNESGAVHLPDLSKFPEITTDLAQKALGVVASAATGILKYHTAAVKYGGTDTPEFQEWFKSEAIGTAIALPIAAGALYMAAGSPLGMAVIIRGGAALTYFEVKDILKDIVDNKSKYEDGSVLVSFAESTLEVLEEVEKVFEPIVEMGGRIIKAFADSFLEVSKELADLLLPEIKFISGEAAGFVTDKDEWLIGSERAVLIGSEDDNTLIHTGYGEVFGLTGNDLLLGYRPEFIEQGESWGSPEPKPGEFDSRPAAEKDLRLTLDGGEGDDYLVVIGGEGAEVIGGPGRDFIFNTSYAGEVYGDRRDGVGQSKTGKEDSDVFWFWPGTIIKDAQPNDILQLFGLPLLGGTNGLLGYLSGAGGGLAIDWLNWTTFYRYTNTNQLVVYNALLDVVLNGTGKRSDDTLRYTLVVEDYDFGGFTTDGSTEDRGSFEFGVPNAGDLGMVFRIFTAPGADGSVEISFFKSTWGHLITLIHVLENFTKLVRWQPVDDPLVLDLDGDGIETVSVGQSGVYFDMDGDYFAERTGWVASDDGFLVLDRNGNGVIDDITEMFGAPGVSGYAELAALDSDGDGFITAGDDAFDALRVWRDLDQDGVTDIGPDDGELFTLADVDIVSLSVTGAALGSETPQGATLRETATFTRGDGSTGNSYEALFETNATDTVFRGDHGKAAWLEGGQFGANDNAAWAAVKAA